MDGAIVIEPLRGILDQIPAHHCRASLVSWLLLEQAVTIESHPYLQSIVHCGGILRTTETVFQQLQRVSSPNSEFWQLSVQICRSRGILPFVSLLHSQWQSWLSWCFLLSCLSALLSASSFCKECVACFLLVPSPAWHDQYFWVSQSITG